MKPQPVDLKGAANAMEVAGRVLRTRLGEAQRLADGLARRDAASLHDFRIACKRLRYALERFAELEPALHEGGECFAQLQDALGEAHDRDVLLAILPVEMAQTERRLRDEREAYVDRAAELWRQALEALRRCALIVSE